MRIFLVFVCIVLMSFFSYSRDYKKYDKALKLFEQKKYSKSKKVLFKILENDNDWDSPNLLLARILFIEGNILKTDSVIVYIHANHSCVSCRGIKDNSSSTVSMEYGGDFQQKSMRKEFFDMVL